MQSQNPHKNHYLSRFRWTKYVRSLVKICQIASIIVKQDNKNLKFGLKAERFLNARQRFFSANTTKKGPKYAKLRHTCQTAFSHAKPLQTSNKTKFWILALKMPTWQSWFPARNARCCCWIETVSMRTNTRHTSLPVVRRAHHSANRIVSKWQYTLFRMRGIVKTVYSRYRLNYSVFTKMYLYQALKVDTVGSTPTGFETETRRETFETETRRETFETETHENVSPDAFRDLSLQTPSLAHTAPEPAKHFPNQETWDFQPLGGHEICVQLVELR